MKEREYSVTTRASIFYVRIKFWWRSGSPSRYRDCLPDSSLLGDTESGINRLRCATPQCTACTSRHHHSNYDVITSPAVGGGMHCPSASSFKSVLALQMISRLSRSRVLSLHFAWGIAEEKCICVSVCLSLATFPQYCTDPDVTLGMVEGAL